MSRVVTKRRLRKVPMKIGSAPKKLVNHFLTANSTMKRINELSQSTKVLMLMLTIITAFFLGNVFSQIASEYYGLNVEPNTVAIVLLVASYFLVRLPQGTFADLVISDTSYAGEFLDAWITKMTTGFETLTKGLIMVQGGIKHKAHVGTLDVSAFIQADQDPPKFGGSITVNKRSFETKPFMGYLEFQPRQFEAHWLAVQLEPKLLDATLPQTFESAVAQKVISLNDQFLDKAIWQSVYDAAAVTTALASGLGAGDNNLIFFDGFIKKMHGDANVHKILTPTAVVLTALNIVSKFDDLKALVLAQPNGSALWYDPRFKILTNYKTFSLYGDAQKAQANKGVDFTKQGEGEYDGKKIERIQGMPDNTIVGCIATRDLDSNLWLGVNEVDEQSYFKMGPLQNNSEKAFMKMLYKIDPQYAISEQTFLYTTLTYS